MLCQQTVCFIGKFSHLSKIPAGIFLHRSARGGARPGRNWNLFAPFLTARRYRFMIHLESAVFVFHMNNTTQGITGSLRAACSEPVQRFLACPFS